MRRIKILYGLEAAGGGALKHLVYLATRLNSNYFDITVILSNIRNENIDCETIKLINAGVRVVTMPVKRNIHVSDILALFKLIVLIRKGKYDIVHAHSSKAGGLFRIAAWLNNVPYIYYTPHCFYFQGRKGVKKLFFIILERILGFITSAVIVSENEQKELIKYKIIIPERALNINNAIDFNEYQQNKEFHKIRMKYGLSSGSIVVGAVGRLTLQKDWVTYIYAANEVLKKYPEVEFLIVGEGELHHKISQLIFKLNLERKIFLTGYVRNINEIFYTINIYVNTSLWEGLPYVLLEAMRYKKPIVATNTANETIVINNENGIITPAKDFRCVANQIIFLIKNKKLAIKMGERGSEILKKKYSFEKFIGEHEKIYMKMDLR